MSFPQGDIEEKYEILRKLAEGGMGAVYVVRHRLLDELRVIKIIRPHLAEKAHLKKRFHREAQAAIKLRHPHIAQIYDFVIDENDVGYTVMELVDGLTLKEILKSGPPPPAFTLEVAAQTLQALGYLHQQGYLHRDVAPDNIMVTAGLDGAPVVKVIDLGLAKRFADELDLTSSGMFVGKVRYASPEQFARPRRRLGPPSDLYCFGIVLYQMLTGVSPIQGSSFEEVIAGHLLSPIPKFSETDPEGRIPDPLRRLLVDLLAKDPAKRPATAEQVFTRLAPLRSSEVPIYREIEQQVDGTALGGRLTRAATVVDFGGVDRRRPTSDDTQFEPTRRLDAPREPSSNRRRRPIRLGARIAALTLSLGLIGGAMWLRQAGVLEQLWLTRLADEASVPIEGAAAPGRLVIDAEPWAQVTRVVDSEGREVTLDAAGLFTPAVLFLEADSYRLELEHPTAGRQELRARVSSAAVARASAPLSPTTSDSYLEAQGLTDLVLKAGS